CSPAGKTREHLTVWISNDEGQSWPVRKEIYHGGSGYSCLVVLPNHDIGVFFEKDGSKSLTFTTVSLASLEE
ncbi:MAG: sialidase family protein, partial [Schlesneria sp.]